VWALALIPFALLVLATAPRVGQAHAQPACTHSYDPTVAAALARIRLAVDPCGESGQILVVLERLARCSKNGYRICANRSAARNVFDRAVADEDNLGTITWNPELRTELEEARHGEPESAVRRDPTASLLHELVHVVQQCDGLNPGEHELDAVRIENIYRRASGLSQRTGYGERPLPLRMVRLCGARYCSCEPPAAPWIGDSAAVPAAAVLERNGDVPERNSDGAASEIVSD
jgi:hypothetical protein